MSGAAMINKTSRRRPMLALFFAAMFFAAAAQNAIAQRHETRRLARELEQVRQQSRELQDEKRSLSLEYLTFTDYRRLRAAAAELRMREPQLQDGSLLFLPPPNSVAALPPLSQISEAKKAARS